tara:strand:- start:8074 stop:8760 length:687 start_codon:yes stop_codon:yes gene_type:complete
MAPATGNNLPAPFSYLLGKHWCTLDTETTGIGHGHQIVEIAVKDGLTGKVLLDTLVRPTRDIDPKAQAVHGISLQTCALAPTWPEVRYKLMEAVKGKTVIIYNANFDIQMLVQTNAAWNINCNGYFGAKEYFCAMTEYSRRARIYNHLHGRNRSFKLVDAAALEGITPKGTLHRAVADCDLTYDLVHKIMSEFVVSANEPEFEELGPEFDDPQWEEVDMPDAEPWREL